MPVYLLLALVFSLITTLPLAWKWGLGVGRAALAAAIVSLTTGALMQLILVWSGYSLATALKAAMNWLLTVAALVGLLAYRFFRDPERRIPLSPNAILSPADGEVLYVRRSREGVLPVSTKSGRSYTLQELTKTPLQMKEAVVIGIGMSLLDVHVNRAPIGGVIATKQHFRGLFGSLRRPEMVFQNERMTTILERHDLQVAVVQIASRLVRQICSFVQLHQQVERGERIGMIRFGSQVDLVLPHRPGLEVTVRPGNRVTAGESIVAVLPGSPSSSLEA